MNSETSIREDICRYAESLYMRGLAHGSTGNISVRLDDGSVIVTPTNSSFGFLDPARLSKLNPDGRHVGGDLPTKEMALHAAFHETRGTRAQAVVHLHSHNSTLLSMLPDTDPDSMIPPLTPYPVMKLGRVKLLPFFAPGDPAMGNAVRALGGERSAVILANHGPVFAAADLPSAVYGIEELEAAARLTIDARGQNPRLVPQDALNALWKAHQS